LGLDYGKKDRSRIVNKTDLTKMLPQFYRSCLQSRLSVTQFLTLEILVWVLQFHKQVRIERLAALFPQPILFESRRRHLQRFLILSRVSVPVIGFPVVKYLLRINFKKSSRLIVSIDRTQWKQNNLFMASLIWEKRAWPLYWQFLDKRGSSNLAEQKALLRPVLRLLRAYEIVVVADREFRSVELANWLEECDVYFALRQKQGTYIKSEDPDYQRLSSIGLAPGMKMFLKRVTITKKKGFDKFALAAYWKRKYRDSVEEQGWYILTNLGSLSAALDAYKARSGIEAMFKDCKTGGYNLEDSHASTERLTRLVLLIALAYTCAGLHGRKIRQLGQQKYVCRLKELGRVEQRHSSFLVGAYGMLWVAGMEFLSDLVTKLMKIKCNKLQFFQRGMRAMILIQPAL
jgi:hypothetical protein